jgi:hypothetical protein
VIEIAAVLTEIASLRAMTNKVCHCEERSDEAISCRLAAPIIIVHSIGLRLAGQDGDDGGCIDSAPAPAADAASL